MRGPAWGQVARTQWGRAEVPAATRSQLNVCANAQRWSSGAVSRACTTGIRRVVQQTSPSRRGTTPVQRGCWRFNWRKASISSLRRSRLTRASLKGSLRVSETTL